MHWTSAAGGLEEGDVLVSNHPQLAGGSHLPDITVMTPVVSQIREIPTTVHVFYLGLFRVCHSFTQAESFSLSPLVVITPTWAGSRQGACLQIVKHFPKRALLSSHLSLYARARFRRLVCIGPRHEYNITKGRVQSCNRPAGITELLKAPGTSGVPGCSGSRNLHDCLSDLRAQVRRRRQRGAWQ